MPLAPGAARPAHPQHVVELEVHKLQQRGVELQEGHHHAVVDVGGQHLRRVGRSCEGGEGREGAQGAGEEVGARGRGKRVMCAR